LPKWRTKMKIVICICASLVLFLPLIASADDKQKKGNGGKAAHTAASSGAKAGKGAPATAGRAISHGPGIGGAQHNIGGAQHNAGNNLQRGGQTGHAQQGLTSHQEAQHGLNSHHDAQHDLTSHQEAKHGLNSHHEAQHDLTAQQEAKHSLSSGKGAQQGLNSRAGNGFKGQHVAGVSPNHPGNRGFARPNQFAGGHWRSGQHWRNYHALYSGYHRSWHDRGWWRGHYNRVVFVGGNYWGGNWYWDGGYWFPAWGYEPGYSAYVYDGPIFAYANLPPDQVVVNIQEALQDQGYYAGEIDGQLGQQTRDALAAYQRDHNLELTAAIDEATVQALGLTTAEEV
jgi:hypothetical protein